jgi:5-formyltetrahydrofolate cyclo-ligase
MSAPTSDRLKRAKRLLRARIRALRDEISAQERDRATHAIGSAVLSLPEVETASTAMVFASFGTEVGTEPIVDGLIQRRVRVALPRVDGDALVPVEYLPGDPMVIAAFGMPEPAGSAVVALEDIDLAITPGVAFDRGGHRVGYGGGFYDRFFAAARPEIVKVGVCFAVQLVDEVPHGPFDERVDVIVTECEVVRCG